MVVLDVCFALQEFAGEGLRTLALAYKDIDEDYFEVWIKKLLFVSTVIENREDQLAALYEEIEQGMKVKLTSLHRRSNQSHLASHRLTADLVEASRSHSNRGQTTGRSSRDNRLSKSG